MRLTTLVLLALAALGTGCDNGPWDAPPNAILSDVEDIQIPWYSCPIDGVTGQQVNPTCEQSGSVIFPISFQVLDGDTDQPLNNVRLTYTSTHFDIFVMPQEVIEAVNLPDTENWQRLDSTAGNFAQFSGRYEGDYRPTYHETFTDQSGVARTWVFVNSMPVNETGAVTESSILVDIGVEVQQLKITAGGG